MSFFVLILQWQISIFLNKLELILCETIYKIFLFWYLIAWFIFFYQEKIQNMCFVNLEFPLAHKIQFIVVYLLIFHLSLTRTMSLNLPIMLSRILWEGINGNKINCPEWGKVLRLTRKRAKEAKRKSYCVCWFYLSKYNNNITTEKFVDFNKINPPLLPNVWELMAEQRKLEKGYIKSNILKNIHPFTNPLQPV